VIELNQFVFLKNVSRDWPCIKVGFFFTACVDCYYFCWLSSGRFFSSGVRTV